MNKNLKPYAPIGLYVSLLALLTAGSLYFIYRQFDLPVQIALGVAVLGLAFFVLLDPDRIRTALTGRQARYGSNALVLVLAFTGIIVVLNYIVYKNPKNWDLTEDKVNTLTDETLQVLDELDGDVTATGYFTARASYPEEQAKDLLEKYKQASNGKLTYSFIDPESNPVMAQAAGITQDRTIVLQMGEQRESVTYASETDLTGALIRLMSGEIRVAYFLTGHGEHDLEGTDEGSYSYVKSTLESKNFQVKSLNLLSENEIPADASLIVIAGPTVPLSQQEVDQLAAFSESGGGLIVMEEPPVLTNYGDADDPLADYLSNTWGITLGNDMVVSPWKTENNEFLAVADQYTSHPITDKLEAVTTFYPTARSLQLNNELQGVTLTPLVLTAPYDTTWAETDMEALEQGSVTPDPETDIPGPITVAAAAENQTTSSCLVVIGDSDFASDFYFYSQLNGNVLINSADWATEQENLINLTPREQTQRFMLPPFPAYTNLVIFVAVFLLPGIFLAAGIWVWIGRRRRS
jgi:ABC-type uncharacterized transport system involved in gliding motility auxiliary subunit